MSTIIERARAFCGRAVLVLLVWMAVMLALPFADAQGRPVAVVGEPHRAVRAIVAAGGAVVEVRGRVTLARSLRPGFVAALYRAGAPLVVEARIGGGCAPLVRGRFKGFLPRRG